MARLPRLAVAGVPHSVIQRGTRQQAIFAEDADYEALLTMFADSARRFQVAVHSYVLMSGHFQLLATPSSASALPQFMQAVGRSYVRYFNQRQGRSGTLWEGRYRSTLIQPDARLLSCMAYIDLSPVRAGLVATPREYRWSSHSHYVGLYSAPTLAPPPIYWQLGNTPFAREVAYAELVAAGLSAENEQAIADSVQNGWPLGSAEFIAEMQGRTARRLTKAAPGRPRKHSI